MPSVTLTIQFATTGGRVVLSRERIVRALEAATGYPATALDVQIARPGEKAPARITLRQPCPPTQAVRGEPRTVRMRHPAVKLDELPTVVAENPLAQARRVPVAARPRRTG